VVIDQEKSAPVFFRSGIFNPLVAHRQQRVLRRHMAFLDFLGRAACGHAQWLPAGAARDQRQFEARAHWYGQPSQPPTK